MASYQLPLALDALYCDEEHWEDNNNNNNNNNGEVECRTQEEEEEEEDCNSSGLSEYDLFWEDEELSCLLSKEQGNELYIGIKEKPRLGLAKVRRDAVEWILKVVEYYSFSALTAVLAVNYLDRFLFGFQADTEKPWMTQLAAVACLSLAAKVEETQVPLLLDFQVEESKFVFEAKTIQRMEILVLSTLKWKMNPVTPLSFLDYIARKLGFKSNLCCEFLRRCEFLLLTIICDNRFMHYLPSTLANATMLFVISSLEPCIGVEYQEQLLNILGINKDKVEDCCRVIEEVATRVQLNSFKKRKFGSLPRSPKGIVDVSFSFDSSNNDLWAVSSSSASSSVSSSPEPLSKKIKNPNDEANNFSSSH